MNRFRLKNIQLLVATDVAARGLDVQDLTHIINYNLPDDPEVYIHRSGRTGRAGKNGICISLIHIRESFRIKDLERRIHKSFEKKMVPGGREICEKQLLNLVDKVENTVVDEVNIKKYLPSILEKLEWLEREELIKRFISVEFNRFLEYYKDAPDLNVVGHNKQSETSQRSAATNFARFHINLGTK
jgi:ATP-dependent RNA helicase DeaD